ncbi:sigma-54-dependent Fis family transcriptional regulator [Tepidibacter formicigenes]|uniref:PAS domain S-box-containing protein n=1 Tax=Tepidibacter formicigenes DSM 15518 TaxID=1123349 RepID=A0A1M6NWD8_9FIRM|nr:sigma 54-interacting transcriptional regulator [Tepidibacter formicigenes]SHK00003.1 PAS domain S-box-containing protein [Tepidibacter formicigenes DSM 15518]
MPREILLGKNYNSMKAWEKFTKSGILDKNLVRDVIAQSWERSKKYGIDPFKENNNQKLKSNEFKFRYRKFMTLLKTAKPLMKSLYKIVEDNGLMIRLTDGEGYILEYMGNSNLLNEYGNLNIQKGSNVNENVIGTNAIALAMINGQPIQVLGGEHYCKQYHNWSSSACPIRDEKRKIIGVLSVTGPSEKIHPHTLGMVVAAAKSIEKQLKLDKSNKKLSMTNKHLFAIMESISEGLIGIDNKGIVKDINLFARRLLSLDEEDIIDKNIREFINEKNNNIVLNVINKGKKYEETEMYFKNKKGKRVYCIVNLTPIKDCDTDEVEGVVITFRKSKTIHNLVNKIIGAEAIFTFDDIIGESEVVKEAKMISKKAAKVNTTILLQGESGTGKELFAQAIHNESPRRSKPFVFLNCGAIPRELVASELFGYVEGAFTGAKRGGHPGKFELADEGTIFLDEIGDMPLDTQANLLRVLETKSVVRVGGHSVIPTDVRVIAATHKDLKKEVEKGNFREDLYYRLNVMPIRTPSLRERRGDIKLLIDYFLEKFSKKMNKQIKGISDSFYKYMKNYDWPGNVRELQNVMQLVINMVEENEIIGYKHLPSYIKPSNLSKKIGMKDELLSLAEIEKIAIIKTLEEVNGNIALASKILGIGRSTLYRKIEKYNIDYII